MTTPSVVPGCIFHWEEYKFSDGETANKYFVILGAKAGQNYLAVIATSKKRRRDFTPGCNSKAGYYHIPGGSKDWFPKDTWLLLAEPIELSPAEFLKKVMQEKAIALQATLRTQMANEIRNCLKRCSDVSDHHLSLL